MTDLFAYELTRARMEKCFARETLPESALDFYSTPHWFENLAVTCKQDGTRYILHHLAGQDRGLVLPLCERTRPVGPLRARILSGLTNFYSCRFELPGLGAVQSIAQWAEAVRARPRRPDEVRFDTLARDEDAGAVEDGLKQAGYWVERFDHFGTWYLPVESTDFEAYWAARPSQLKNTLARKHKQLEKRHRMSVKAFKTDQNGPSAIADYESVYRHSWQSGEPFPDFTPGLIRYGLRDGSLQVWCLYADDAPIAAQIWTVKGGRATLFKLAYDQRFKSFSPGTVLTWHAMQDIFSIPFLYEIDLGRGDDHYKSSWLPVRRQILGVAAYEPDSFVGKTLALRNFAPQYLRNWVRFGKSARADSL